MRIVSTSRILAWVLASAVLPACGSTTEDTPAPVGPAVIDDDLPSACSPLRFAGACALPFPNAIDTRADSSSPTGFRLALHSDALPKEASKGIPLSADRFNLADGFSPATPILAYFPERIDPESLPFVLNPDTSLSPSSATVVVDMETKELVAHFAEVDQKVEEGERQALLIRPLKRLEAGRRYAVAITRSIRTVEGTVPSSPPLWSSIVNGNPPADERAQAQAERMPEILTALAAAGVQKDDLVLAWDFVTASDHHLTRNVLAMREQALPVIGEEGIGYTIETVEEKPSEHVLRRIVGTYKVPRFLSQTNQSVPEATLDLDETGLPKWRGDTYDVPFSLIIPERASEGPLPLMIFGHGLFGSGVDYMKFERIQKVANEYGWIVAATDWTGLSKWELPGDGASAAAVAAISDLNKLPYITDRLQQSVINAIALTRTARGVLADDPLLTLSGEEGGTPVLAKDQPVGYFGISLGGIMGTTFMAYSPDILRGVTNVAGSTWSLMFQRSSNWKFFDLVVGGTYPDPLEQQVLLALAQAQFDFTDPINVAPHILKGTLPDTPAKQILQQMSVADAQVPNVSSEILARTMGLPLLSDSPLDIWGMPPQDGPLENAFGVWDLTAQAPSIPPNTNATPQENLVHASCSALEELQEQTDHFLRTGEIVSTCNGKCVFDVELE